MTFTSKKLRKISSSIAKALDFPAESVSAEPTFDLAGNRELRIFSCTSICSFSSELVVVRCPLYIVSIKGEGMNIADFVGGGVTVTGTIREMVFDEV